MIVLRVRARAQPASAARLVRARSLADARLSLRKQSSTVDGYKAKFTKALVITLNSLQCDHTIRSMLQESRPPCNRSRVC